MNNSEQRSKIEAPGGRRFLAYDRSRKPRTMRPIQYFSLPGFPGYRVSALGTVLDAAGDRVEPQVQPSRSSLYIQLERDGELVLKSVRSLKQLGRQLAKLLQKPPRWLSPQASA